MYFFKKICNFEDFMDFLDTQRDTLKFFQLQQCFIDEESLKRLLSLELVRLEFIDCGIELSHVPAFENASIKSLAFHGVSLSNLDAICNFIESCSNLSAFVASTVQEPPDCLSTKSWTRINTEKKQPKADFSVDPRRLRYSSVWYAFIDMSNPGIHCYYDTMKEVPVEHSPHSVIKFEERSDVAESKEDSEFDYFNSPVDRLKGYLYNCLHFVLALLCAVEAICVIIMFIVVKFQKRSDNESNDDDDDEPCAELFSNRNFDHLSDCLQDNCDWAVLPAATVILIIATHYCKHFKNKF